MIRAEYIWIDGTSPVKQLRSKVRYLQGAGYPMWSFDGSSTNQASGHDSDLILNPVKVVNDSVNSAIVLCQVLNPDLTPHASNTRAKLSRLQIENEDSEILMGFEQEYAFKECMPWSGEIGKQGPYYCSVGADKALARPVVEEHAEECLVHGLLLYGTNAEVMPGQWEFQIGYRGIDGEPADPLTVADNLWIARFLLHKVGEKHALNVTFDCKPVKGDWNGSGCHANFSTADMRSRGGIRYINKAIRKLAAKHNEHIAVYGYGLEERLTGLHETCRINEFKSGVGHRGASIRIPTPVAAAGRGYLEDRRPGANCDPYEVAAILIETICE